MTVSYFQAPDTILGGPSFWDILGIAGVYRVVFCKGFLDLVLQSCLQTGSQQRVAKLLAFWTSGRKVQ